MPEQMRERDLVLGPNEYAMILDQTKGNVMVNVGPTKTTLSDNDRPVVLDASNGSFKRCDTPQEAIRLFPSANEGSYVVLKNPAAKEGGGGEEFPRPGNNTTPKLLMGRRVNIPGPVSFPLWPGQIANVIDGHLLRSNQYMVVRVYNDGEAKKHWAAAVVKPQTLTGTGEASKDSEKKEGNNAETRPQILEVRPDTERPELTMGQLLVIKGTKVSFYIPPTGIEVVPDNRGQFVRDAVTLERLEYCILLDEDGNKRFVRGPAVVFPKSTETFIEKDGSRKFQAIELNEIMGLYVKVIADYEDEGGKHEAGKELFITGKEKTIYFPRQEHAIVKYGDHEVHFAVAIPEGEARYVLDRRTGKVELVEGPKMFLPDPRTQVVVRRVLDVGTVGLWFPGNNEAMQYNLGLAALAGARRAGDFLTERDMSEVAGRRPDQHMASAALRGAEAGKKGLVSEGFERGQSFTPPRTITLDTKYEGAVAINVWTGYAIQVISKTGKREVITGPKTVLLAYDETLEVLTMSTGTPKSDDRLVRTVYLLVQNNKVSDEVQAETSDLVKVSIRASYRVNFEGDPTSWFNVDNYVKLLTDHLRSLIRNAVKQHGVEKFNRDAIAIIRDTVLGVQSESGKRTGRHFQENGMVVYDVEVLDVAIGDDHISGLLVNAQHESVRMALQVAQGERGLETAKRLEKIAQETALARAETAQKQLELERAKLVALLAVDLARIDSEVRVKNAKLVALLAEQENMDKVTKAELGREKAKADQRLAITQEEQEQVLAKLEAEVKAVVDRAKAFGPEVVAALQAFADKDLAGKMAESMAPMAILGGTSVAEVLNNLLRGTILEKALANKGGENKR